MKSVYKYFGTKHERDPKDKNKTIEVPTEWFVVAEHAQQGLEILQRDNPKTTDFIYLDWSKPCGSGWNK